MSEPTSISDGITAAAACVALGVPFLMDYLQRRRANEAGEKSFKAAVIEVLAAAEEAVAVYRETAAVIRQWTLTERKPSTGTIRDLEERAHRADHVIKHLIAKHDLTDGVVRCAFDAGALGIETGAAVGLMHNGQPAMARARAQEKMVFNIGRHNRTCEQLDALRAHFKLPAAKRLEAPDNP